MQLKFWIAVGRYEDSTDMILIAEEDFSDGIIAYFISVK